MSKKILNHPDKDEILRRLNEGEGVRSVNAWLKQKYSTNKRFQVTVPTLQSFRKNYLKLEGKVLKDIQQKRAERQKAIDEQQKQARLEASNAYQEKLNSIADTHLDVAQKILQLDKIIDSRMEYWYNSISSGEATPVQADKEMRAYMDRQMQLLQQYKKFIEGMADHTVQHNINVKVFNDQITVFRDIIGEILTELSPDKAMRFMDMVNNRLMIAEYSQERQIPETVDVDVLNETGKGLFPEGNND